MKKFKIKLHTKIFLGLVLGVIAGLAFGDRILFIKPVGDIFMNLITMIVVPLVFVSLMLGTASMGDIRKLGRIGAKTSLYFVLTTVVAIIVGLLLANTIRPGEGLSEDVRAELHENYMARAQDGIQRIEEKPNLIDVLVRIVPRNPVAAFVEGNMLQIIFMALLFGVVLTMIDPRKSKLITDLLDGLNDMFIQVVHVVMKLAPYGVFALSAAVVGQFGFGILVTLIKYSAVVIGGLILYTVTFNSLTVGLLGHMNPVLFFKAVKEAIIIAVPWRPCRWPWKAWNTSV